MEMTKFYTLLSAAVLAAAGSVASAATISTDTTPDLSLYGLEGSFSNVSIVAGDEPNVFASPFGDKTTKYYTVGSPGYTPSPAVLTLDAVATTFSMLWGSIDSYNAVEFLLGNLVQDTVSGAELGLGTAGNVTASVDFSNIGDNNLTFDTVKFYSNFGRNGDQAAFEFATRLSPVPVPAAGLLLLGALGGLAALRRRKTA